MDYNDRLFCFGRNKEGQLDPPIAMSTAAWEIVYAPFFAFAHFGNLILLFSSADTRDGQQHVVERSETRKILSAGVTKAARSLPATFQNLLLQSALFGSRYL